jgi:hypothetical protein
MAGLRGKLCFWGLLTLAAAAIAIVGTRATHEGWFTYRLPLDLQGRPTLLFFTLSQGCPCQMRVVRGAEAQIAGWSEAHRGGLPVIRIDLIERRDLGEQFGITRAPALVLVDWHERVVWRQDEAISDESPLDLAQAEARIERFLDPGGG